MDRLDADPPIKISRPQKIRNVINSQRLKKAEEKLRNQQGPSNERYTPMQFLRVARHTFTLSNRKYFKQLEETLTEDPSLGGDIETNEEQEEQVKNTVIPFTYFDNN